MLTRKCWIYLITFDASCSELFLITSSTIDLLFSGNKRSGANWYLAYATWKTFLMPLPSFILHLLCSCKRKIKQKLIIWCHKNLKINSRWNNSYIHNNIVHKYIDLECKLMWPVFFYRVISIVIMPLSKQYAYIKCMK